MAKFLHFAFNFKTRPALTDELKPVFDSALDWYRYAPNCWIAWTTKSPKEWYELIKPKIHADDTMLIVELNSSNRYGYLSKDAWEWLDKDRSA